MQKTSAVLSGTPMSCTTLLAILQRHGLTTDALIELAHFVERGYTGTVLLHVVDGTFGVFECRGQRRMSHGTKKCLTAHEEAV